MVLSWYIQSCFMHCYWIKVYNTWQYLPTLFALRFFIIYPTYLSVSSSLIWNTPPVFLHDVLSCPRNLQIQEVYSSYSQHRQSALGYAQEEGDGVTKLSWEHSSHQAGFIEQKVRPDLLVPSHQSSSTHSRMDKQPWKVSRPAVCGSELAELGGGGGYVSNWVVSQSAVWRKNNESSFA